MELSSSSFKYQSMKSVEKRHQQNLINHHLPITLTNRDNNKIKRNKIQKQQQFSNVLINHKQFLPVAASTTITRQQQQQNNKQQHSTGLISKSPVAFPVYELALPATLLAFIIFGILFILGFIIYKLFKYFCGGHKQKRRLTKDNIYYQTVRNRNSVTPTKTNTLFYRYRFTPKRNIGMDEPESLLDDEDVYGAHIGVIAINEEESKCKKSPPPSPYDRCEDEMQTPEAQLSSNPNSPSFIVSIPQYSDEINSNLNTDRSALQFLQGDIHYVQPIMMAGGTVSARQAEDQQAASSPYIGDNLSKVKYMKIDQSDSSASSPLFTACEVISGSTLGSASRFSFSPKNLKELSSSPLLPSVGNYFKFPEVDNFTPTNKANNNNVNEEDKECGTPLIETLHINDDGLTEVYKTPLNLDDDTIQTNSLGLPEIAHEAAEVSKNNRNLLSEHRTRTRRVRLKSISLDSDQAKLVEENIGVPVEELVGGATNSDVPSQIGSCESKLTRSNTGRARKINKFNLTINVVDQPDSCSATNTSSLQSSSKNVFRRSEAVPIGAAPPPQTPKTPIQKAASLDSEPTFLPPPHLQHPLLHHSNQQNIPSSSISVPSTPKRQPFATPKHKYSQKMYTTANKSYGCLRQPSSMDSGGSTGSNNNLYFYSKCNRKLRSYDENISSLMTTSNDKADSDKIDEIMDDNDDYLTGTGKSSSSITQGMCSLQVTKFNTLNVSNTNLKTLPESEKLIDFSSEQQLSKSEGIPVTTTSVVTPSSVNTVSGMVGQKQNKCSIIQRRGSNHSLTLQIDGSISNLARGLSLSNYSLGAMQGSSYNLNSSNYNIATSSNQAGCQSILNQQQQPHQYQTQQQLQHHHQRAQQRKLLQRRGSNCSLTLNIKDSNSSLNRFNSQHSLNINKKALSISNCNLNRRNFTSSLNNVVDRSKMVLQSSDHHHQSIITSHHLHHHDQSSTCTQEDDTHTTNKDTRKFLSSENLHHFTIWSKYNENQTPYGSIDDFNRTTVIKDIDIDDEWTACDDPNDPGNQGGSSRNITTKPLSPQATSEDFKIYLANIQFLQNASRSLNEKQLQSLNELFQKSYSNNSKTKDDDPVLGGSSRLFLTKEKEDEEQDQKNALIKLHQEFWDLPTNYQEKPMVFGSQAKNRYKTILPNEHSRVRIDPEPDSTQEPYINANYIKGPDYSSNCYIATQGPMTNTIYDFWLMVYQNMSKSDTPQDTKIAMLTDFIENSRQKCAHYFPKDSNESIGFSCTNIPEENDSIIENIETILAEVNAKKDGTWNESDAASYFRPSFNYFLVRNVDVRVKNGYSIRKLKVIYSYADFRESEDGNEPCSRTIIEFPVFHYWFPDWPDHRSPEDIDGLLDMSLDLLYGDCYIDFPTPSKEIPDPLSPEPNNVTPSKPHLIIHCSAGIGRTGCLIAILNGLRQIKQSIGTQFDSMTQRQSDAIDNQQHENTANLAVDILQIVCNLRIQRGGMVQNSEQYELIHRAICLYHQRLNLELENHLSTQL
uniref:CSON003505 protein n=1 Tax=Culicoides sonorensis TaxID=179676 RepID=A0A336LT08_CULSO